MSNKNLNQARRRLLHRIGRQYHVVTEEVQIGPSRFQFTRIADPDLVLDQVAAEADLRDRLHGSAAPADQLHLPYWAELWESGKGMGAYLTDHEHLLDGRGDTGTRGRGDFSLTASPRPRVPASAVLDLGCGMGMAGMVAASMGARVVFADLEAPALLFARLNSLPWQHRVETRRLNWQRDRLNRRFDLILGSDILYERVQWPFLDTFWKEHLAVGGQVLLGEPGRQTGDLFIDWVAAKGWALTCTEIPVTGRPRPIRIFSLRR